MGDHHRLWLKQGDRQQWSVARFFPSLGQFLAAEIVSVFGMLSPTTIIC